MSVFNKRAMERFELELPTRLTPVGETQKEPLDLFTDNVSSGGAMFITDHVLDIGTEVKVEIFLATSKLKKIKSNKVLIKVQGRVNRIKGNTMAVSFDNHHRISAFPV